MSKPIASQIAEHFGWDIADVRGCEDHPGHWTRRVYDTGMDGNRYWSAGGNTPPKQLVVSSSPPRWVRVKSNWPGNPDLWATDAEEEP